jgi:hypothetical protein
MILSSLELYLDNSLPTLAFPNSRKHGKCGFQLYSLSCEHCDGRLGRYMCSSLSKGSDPVRYTDSRRGPFGPDQHFQKKLSHRLLLLLSTLHNCRSVNSFWS